MNLKLLKLVLTYVKNVRSLLWVVVGLPDPKPHFPRSLRAIPELWKDDVWDTVMGFPEEIPLSEIKEVVSSNTFEAITRMRANQFMVDALADYATLIWCENVISLDSGNHNALELKQKLIDFWSRVTTE